MRGPQDSGSPPAGAVLPAGRLGDDSDEQSPCLSRLPDGTDPGPRPTGRACKSAWKDTAQPRLCVCMCEHACLRAAGPLRACACRRRRVGQRASAPGAPVPFRAPVPDEPRASERISAPCGATAPGGARARVNGKQPLIRAPPMPQDREPASRWHRGLCAYHWFRLERRRCAHAHTDTLSKKHSSSVDILNRDSFKSAGRCVAACCRLREDACLSSLTVSDYWIIQNSYCALSVSLFRMA